MEVGRNNRHFTALVLAGGKASRMGGIDKPRLDVHGRPIIETVLEVVRPLFHEIIVAEGAEGRYRELSGVRRVADAAVGVGPLAGILAGLEACTTQWAFVVAADMPLLSGALIQKIADSASDDVDAVVPKHEGLMEPLHAAYSTRLIPAIQHQLVQNNRKTYELFDAGNTRFVEMSTDERAHMCNVNNLEDLKVVRAHAAASGRQ